MNNIQENLFYTLKELQILMNDFEKVYLVLTKNIDKFNISSDSDKFYLSWVAGLNFYGHNDIHIKQMETFTFFENIAQLLNIQNLSLKSILFIYFSIAAIHIKNYKNIKSNDFYIDYIKNILHGAIVLEVVKSDNEKDGSKSWDISTLHKYFTLNYQIKDLFQKSKSFSIN